MSDSFLDYDALGSLQELLGENFGLLLETFLTDGQQRTDLIVQAMNDNNLQLIREQAHGLKGSCNNLGIAKLGMLCNEIEVQAGEENADGLEQKVASLQQMFAVVQSEIQRYRR